MAEAAPAPRARCVHHVARWFGPSQALQQALAPWAAEQRLTVNVVDTLAACHGVAALTPPGTLQCRATGEGGGVPREVKLPLAPLSALGARLDAALPDPAVSTAQAAFEPSEGLGRPRLRDVNAAGASPAALGGWPRAVLGDDAASVRAGWPRMDAPARLTACTLAAAAGANAVLAAVLQLDAGLARGVDAAPAGNTPLHYAALGANAVGVRLLLRCGASPAAQNPVGTLPVHDAARAADPAALAALATASSLQAINRYGDTVLHRLALYGGDKPEAQVTTCLAIVVRKLRDACGPRGLRAQLARPNVDGFTPLDLAVAGGQRALARRLEAWGAVHGARWRARGGAGFDADEVVHVPLGAP